MADELGIDFGSSLDWMNQPAKPESQATEPDADKIAVDAPAAEVPKVEEPVTPVEPETPVDEPPLIPLVEDLGGEDGARQLIPLVQALQDVDAKPE